VFIAIDPKGLGVDQMNATADAMIANLRAAEPAEAGKPVRYPGEQTLRVRQENLELGVPVEEDLWKQLLAQDY
jgi:3-dehydro-L-gulonate 2-dehydrogenase